MRDFVELGLQAGRVSDGFTNVSDILRRLGVIAPDGALTNAAAVAFYKAPSAYPEMKLGLLAGNDKLDIFDLQQEGLPLIQLFKRAEFFVVPNIRRRFVFGEPGMQRREIPEIPREAVANVLCHRDYTTGTAVEVNVYMDFVEVVSPASSPRATRRKTIWREETAASSSATRASCRRSSARERSSSTARASPASSDTATPRA